MSDHHAIQNRSPILRLRTRPRRKPAATRHSRCHLRHPDRGRAGSGLDGHRPRLAANRRLRHRHARGRTPRFSRRMESIAGKAAGHERAHDRRRRGRMDHRRTRGSRRRGFPFLSIRTARILGRHPRPPCGAGAAGTFAAHRHRHRRGWHGTGNRRRGGGHRHGNPGQKRQPRSARWRGHFGKFLRRSSAHHRRVRAGR